MPYLEGDVSLRNIAERLSLIQRWNGRTTIPWTVLQHSILAAALLPEDANPYTRLVTLLHDAGEGWVGDIPRGFKCPEQADLERDLLAEIYESLGLVPPSLADSAKIHYTDDVTALVEAQCLVHPAERRAVAARHLDIYRPDSPLVERGEDLLWSMRDMPRHEVIRVWIISVETLIFELTEPEEVELFI